jgi:hypothetical protein
VQDSIAYDIDSEYRLRPQEANNFVDTASINRLWDNVCGRLFAPVTTLWIFALSTGEGWTASILRRPFLVDVIAPHAYNCFLFHQPVGQWYFAATRKGHWWNWWRYRKTMYWFSPEPVGFSSVMNATAMPLMSAIFNSVGKAVFGNSKEEDFDVENALIEAIEDMSGFTPDLDWTLDQCGLSSVGLPQLALRLEKALSTKSKPMPVSAGALSSARTVGDIAKVLEEIHALADANGV